MCKTQLRLILGKCEQDNHWDKLDLSWRTTTSISSCFFSPVFHQFWAHTGLILNQLTYCIHPRFIHHFLHVKMMLKLLAISPNIHQRILNLDPQAVVSEAYFLVAYGILGGPRPFLSHKIFSRATSIALLSIIKNSTLKSSFGPLGGPPGKTNQTTRTQKL